MNNLAYAPTGSPIVGTLERIQGTALASVTISKTGITRVHFEGETLIDWNSQESEKDKKGLRLFVDADNCIWSESQLVLNPNPKPARPAERQHP